MPVVVPTSIETAVEAMSQPGATALAGGTDLMVELNEGHRSMPWEPDGVTVVALNRLAELSSYTIDASAGMLRLGAGVTWSAIERDPLQPLVPALAEAARTVGSPQIRNAGTIGGNLATCSPAGDGLPVLSALGAVVHLVGTDRSRTLAIDDFMVGVKRTALEPGELIEAVTLPILDGWQGYSKVGVRNAMVIATASACVATDVPNRSIRIALGSVAPTVIRCPEAEALAAGGVDWDARAISPEFAAACGDVAAAATSPIDDHRSTADYRRHAIAVMVRRLLVRAFPGPQGDVA